MDLHPLFGQFKTNKNGGVYQNGKPLDEQIRKSIVEMKQRGFRVKDISKELGITHGVVSKILKNWTATGSWEPRKRQVLPRTTESKKEGFSVQELLAVPVKKSRALYEPGQLVRLEALFLAQMYPNEEQKMKLEQETGLSRQQIDTWFNNKRCRLRKKVVGDVVNSKSASPSSSVSSVTPPVTLTLEAIIPSYSNTKTETVEVDVVGNLSLAIEEEKENFNRQPKPIESHKMPPSAPSTFPTYSPVPSFLSSMPTTPLLPSATMPTPTLPFLLPSTVPLTVDTNAYAFWLAYWKSITGNE